MGYTAKGHSSTMANREWEDGERWVEELATAVTVAARAGWSEPSDTSRKHALCLAYDVEVRGRAKRRQNHVPRR